MVSARRGRLHHARGRRVSRRGARQSRLVNSRHLIGGGDPVCALRSARTSRAPTSVTSVAYDAKHRRERSRRNYVYPVRSENIYSHTAAAAAAADDDDGDVNNASRAPIDPSRLRSTLLPFNPLPSWFSLARRLGSSAI